MAKRKLIVRANEIELTCTCNACPEQYDAHYQGKLVGYLRLRHGIFTVFCDSILVLQDNSPKGDGIFQMTERRAFLFEARAAIARELMRRDMQNV